MVDENEKIQSYNPFLLGNRAYDFLKKLVQVILPAFSAAYFALANIWGLPHAEQVVGTIAVVTTFLGVCLGISSAQYTASGRAFDGKLIAFQNDPAGPKTYRFEVDGDPHDIPNQKTLTLKVENRLPVAAQSQLPTDDPIVAEPPQS